MENIKHVSHELIPIELLKKTPSNGYARIELGFEMQINHEFNLIINVRLGAFSETEKKFRRRFVLPEWCYRSEIRNFVINSLTFEGSPFFLENGQFKMQRILAG